MPPSGSVGGGGGGIGGKRRRSTEVRWIQVIFLVPQAPAAADRLAKAVGRSFSDSETAIGAGDGGTLLLLVGGITPLSGVDCGGAGGNGGYNSLPRPAGDAIVRAAGAEEEEAEAGGLGSDDGGAAIMEAVAAVASKAAEWRSGGFGGGGGAGWSGEFGGTHGGQGGFGGGGGAADDGTHWFIPSWKWRYVRR